MKTLDRALTDAANDVRGRIAAAPKRPVAQLKQRRQHRTTSTVALVVAMLIGIPAAFILLRPSSRPLPEGAVRIDRGGLPTEELVAVADLRRGDELYLIPKGDHSVFVRLRQGERTLLFGTSCDVVSGTPLPAGWEGVCLEYTSNGQRVSGRFPYGTTSDGSEAGSPADSPDGPIDLPDGPLSTALTEAISQIPELAKLTREQVTDQSVPGGQWGIVSLVARDGSRIEITTQEAPPAEILDRLASVYSTSRQIGPNGEDLILRDTDTTLQVIAIDASGTMLNLSVDRINQTEPGSPSEFSHLHLDQIREWALLLLGLISN